MSIDSQRELANELRDIFVRSLKQTGGSEYFINRGLSESTIEMAQLGSSPQILVKGNPDPNALYRYFCNSYGKTVTDDSGFFVVEDDIGYNRYDGRYVIPMHDPYGQVVSFAGRLATNDDKSPKYVNGKGSPIFSKSELLFGVGLKTFPLGVSKSKRIVITEGYMDVLQAVNAGFHDHVAICGIELLRKGELSQYNQIIHYIKHGVNEVVIALDGDIFGLLGMVKAYFALKEVRLPFSVKVVPLANEDPDDIIREDPDLWYNMIEKAERFDYRKMYSNVVKAYNTTEKTVNKSYFNRILYMLCGDDKVLLNAASELTGENMHKYYQKLSRGRSSNLNNIYTK